MEYLENSLRYPSNENTQTWLSRISINHRTCTNGFSDFNISVPAIALNISSVDTKKFISNLLAINKASMPQKLKNNHDDDRMFPEWLDIGDRRLLRSKSVNADLVVAKDGSGNFMTITEALTASVEKREGGGRFVVYIKEGVYSENVEITNIMTNLMFVGDGIDRTVVTGSRNVVDGATTFNSATVVADGEGFIAKYMTFENTAGPEKQQAVAFRSSSEKSVFYQCSFKGYQDTLYVHSMKQFYSSCDIYGTVDFIFGDASVVIQNSNIYVRRPMDRQKNTITAQGRENVNENTGISIQCSTVTAAPDLQPVQGSFQTYLGRPWKEYSRTVFMECNLDSLIAPEGWLPWDGNFALDTLYYGEYENAGPGADTAGRVGWNGYNPVMSSSDASQFTVNEFLFGGSWIADVDVGFEPQLNCHA
ncbi:pectin methylesterase, family CE8 [Zostera marina]|uniref:Pectinesterase n=1 Tax=Zostera marina TaxID=29655 RepID=A0A0K9P009_ZOSMR|nr:pectin methylesterase, family CE8 [Zostera marina]